MALLVGLALMVTVAAQADDVAVAAVEAGVDPQDLRGAVASTGMDPRDYLVAVGDLPSPVAKPASPDTAPAPQVTITGVWARLAQCESNGRWSIATGNGYYGGLQEDMSFWRRYGGPAYASRPDLASPAAQIAVATRGLAAQGWGAWPRCSRILGLR
jgi:hypothetical protein